MPVIEHRLAEGDVETAGERLGRRLRGADIGAHRDVHADKAGGTRKDGADREADRDIQKAEGRGR